MKRLWFAIAVLGAAGNWLGVVRRVFFGMDGNYLPLWACLAGGLVCTIAAVIEWPYLRPQEPTPEEQAEIFD